MTKLALPPEDRCVIGIDCDEPAETVIVGWAGGTGWIFDACWPCALERVDVMSLNTLRRGNGWLTS